MSYWPDQFGGLGWFPFLAIVAALGAGLAVWSVVSAPGRRPIVVFSALLKALAMIGLAVVVAEPLYVGERAKSGANLFLVVADNSRSLQLRDRNASRTRAETMTDLLASDSGWRARLGQDFEVRNYQFDTRLQAVDDFGGMDFEGRSTSLAAALQAIGQRYADRPVGGVLLLTDGNADVVGDEDWSSLPPIFPVPIGRDAPAKDIRVDRVVVNQSNFETAPISLQADIVAEGGEGAELVVELLDESKEPVARKEIVAKADGEPVTVHFDFRPVDPGLQFYELRTYAKNEGSQFAIPERSEEATLFNNTRHLLVDRGGGPFRVLYVAGRPNWEFKFLRRAMDAEQEINLAGLIRIAKREPKLKFKSRAGERTNPLFRGFGNEDDELAEQYDEPVLLRLGVEDSEELRDGFPKTPEALFRYDAILIDDIEADFFTTDQMILLQRYVNQRGGGLMMLAGQESFENGGYDRTPLGDLLPVYLDRYDGLPDDGNFRLQITRDGMHPPWSFFRVRGTATGEQRRLEEMPAFVTLNRVSGVKPGAVILATALDNQQQHRPALTAQRFGAGRTSALLIGDLWRWAMRRQDEEEHDLAKVWRQTVRWLVSETPKRVEVRIEPGSQAGDLARQIRVTLRDPEYLPLDNATVHVMVETPNEETIELPTQPVDEQPGVYETTYVPRQAGAFRASVKASGPDGADLGTAVAGWTSEPDRIEFDRLRPNRDALARLAESSGGELIEPARLERFVQTLPNRKMPKVETWVFSWWDNRTLKIAAFLALVAAIAFDWGARRWNGLA